jgi:hypothetical protein
MSALVRRGRAGRNPRSQALFGLAAGTPGAAVRGAPERVAPTMTATVTRANVSVSVTAAAARRAGRTPVAGRGRMRAALTRTAAATRAVRTTTMTAAETSGEAMAESFAVGGTKKLRDSAVSVGQAKQNEKCGISVA